MSNIGLGKREENFKKYVEKHFGIKLPEGIELFYVQGVRIGNAAIRASRITGDLGYAACDAGFNPTNALAQNFGHLAKKNTVSVTELEAKQFAAGKGLKRDLGKASKFVIVKYYSHVIGLGHYSKDQKKILNEIPEKRRREIINSL